MAAYWIDFFSLLARWTHVVVGIAWIGASFYFVWLDNHLDAPSDDALKSKGVGGELWAVHGGGFYNPQKYGPAGPRRVADTLHWFYWEAYSTWLTGFLLLCLVYYRSPEVSLLDPTRLAPGGFGGVAVGLGFLIGGWLIYHALCRSPLARSERALGLSIAGLLGLAAWALCQTFSGRGAFLHFGAMLGTMMVANVFFVIIPGQRKMVAAIRAGQLPDPIHGKHGKQRSVHNTYFTLPVLFTMISNHYATTYGGPSNWIALILLCVGGAAIRHWFVLRHRARERDGKTSPVALIIALAAIVATAALLQPTTAASTAAAPVTAERAQAILAARCTTCHAEQPRFADLAAAPNGAMFDTPERAHAKRSLIAAQLQSGAMPPGNLTAMTPDERAELLRWASTP